MACACRHSKYSVTQSANVINSVPNRARNGWVGGWAGTEFHAKMGWAHRLQKGWVERETPKDGSTSQLIQWLLIMLKVIQGLLIDSAL